MESKKKILIVDDEPEVLSVLEKRLTSSGFDVIKADHGRRALALSRSEKPDLVILDIDMPDMDGGEVAARMKDEEKTKNIPILFLSCLVTEKEQSRNRVGDSLFISKPYSPEALICGVNQMLSEHAPL